ncbi:hypothetical protein T439DRAFT_378788 [Meredithblackwellia eburnea MCA 4105]
MTEKGKQKEGTISLPATVSLPLSFKNSFWSQDYRNGYETLYAQLDAGCIQSEEIILNIQRRAHAERQYANDLHPPALRPDGFGIDEGASLKMGLEALLSSAVQESRAHLQLADELIKSIVKPFEDWSEAHKGRIRSSRALIESHLVAYEKKYVEVQTLKTKYDEACRNADSAEDELAFLKGSIPNSTTSPTSPSAPVPVSTATPPRPLGLSSKATTTASTPPPPPAKKKSNDGENTEDSLPSIEDDDEDDKTLVDRSGATGGSITAALGRAFTVRRKQLVAAAREVTQQAAAIPSTPPPAGGAAASPAGGKESPSTISFANDPNVGAALDWSKSTFSSLLEKVAGPQTGEGKSDKARRDAEATEEKYKAAVYSLDQLRLTLEEALSEHFAYAHRCEQDRLKAATSVLRSFHATISSLPIRIAGSSDKVTGALQLIRPERDVLAIVERLRTGPFQPRPTVYHSHYSEPSITTFGIDLRKFDETNTAQSKVPPVLTFLLDHLKGRYSSLPDAEQRKAWLYETPLAAQHHLRSALNDPNSLDNAVVSKFDLPVVAATVKLWLLELDVPVVIFSHYDEYRSLYPNRVGAEIVEVPAKAVGDHIARLPPVHLEVLRTLISHFVDLVKSTKTDESDEVYLQKLALSVARCLLRPKVDTALTLDDRFPTLLFIDLIKSYDVIFASADELKTKQREDRYKPRRQRTKPVDVRMSRSRIGVDASGSVDLGKGRDLLKEQRAGLASPPPVPPLPPLATDIPAAAAASPSAPSAGFSASPTSATTPLPAVDESAEAKDVPDEVPQPAASAPPAAPSALVEVDGQPIAGGAQYYNDMPTLKKGPGSLTRKEGVSSARRGARGPRPLRPASGGEVTASAPPTADEEVEEDARSASFTRSRPSEE